MFSFLRRAARYRINVFHILAVVALAAMCVVITLFVFVQYILPRPFHTVYAERATQFEGSFQLPTMNSSNISPNLKFADEHNLLGLWKRSCTAKTGATTVSLAGTDYYPDLPNDFWLYIENAGDESVFMKKDQFNLKFKRLGNIIAVPVVRMDSLSLDLTSEGIKVPIAATRTLNLETVEVAPGKRLLVKVTLGHGPAVPKGGTIDVTLRTKSNIEIARCRFHLDYFPPPLY